MTPQEIVQVVPSLAVRRLIFVQDTHLEGGMHGFMEEGFSSAERQSGSARVNEVCMSHRREERSERWQIVKSFCSAGIAET